MTIWTEISSNPCIVTMPDPGGQTRIRGRVWRWEYIHGRLELLRADGEPMNINAWPSANHPLWRAVRRWEKRNGKAKR
jgi:hypothetical protein